MASGGRGALLLLLFLGTLLLFHDLGGLSFSVDEFVNVEIERGDGPQILADLLEGRDLHPPLSHLVMSLWLDIVGESEWTVRFLWALVGLLNLCLLYRLGVVLRGKRLGLLAALLMLTVSTFLLYTRFDKYYALTVALSLSSLLAGLRLWQQPSRANMQIYAIFLVGLLYTDYLAPLFLVLGQNLLLFWADRHWRRLRFFLVAQGLAAVAFLPWISILGRQTSTLTGMGVADLGGSWRGLVLQLAYLPYSFTLGETLFPWHPVAILGLFTITLVVLYGLWRTKAQPILGGRSTFAAFWVTLLVPALLGAAGMTTFLFPSVPFIAFPNHVLFILPLVSLLLAASLLSIGSGRWFVLALVFILLPRSVGVYNYFQGTSFHNPIYAVPTRQVVTQLLRAATPNDVVISAYDIGAHHYYQRLRKRSSHRPAPVLFTDNQRALDYLRVNRPQQVWLLLFGRDRTRANSPGEIMQWLEASDYTLAFQSGYAKQDPVYRQIKEWVFGREAYRHKLLVRKYRRPQ